MKMTCTEEKREEVVDWWPGKNNDLEWRRDFNFISGRKNLKQKRKSRWDYRFKVIYFTTVIVIIVGKYEE